MKVLTIVSDLGRGGTQRVAVDVAICYKQHGHDSAVLTRRGSGPRAVDLEAAGVQVFAALNKSQSPDTPWNQQAQDWAPDVIHFHRIGLANHTENNLIRYLKGNRGSEVRVIEHSHFGRCDRSDDHTLIDVHIQISKWCLWRWQKWARGLKDKPIGVYIPHMVNASKFTPANPEHTTALREQHQIPRDAFVYGYLAQSLRPKWAPVLFNAFNAIALRNSNAYLLIAGIDEYSKSHYKDFPESTRSKIIELPFVKGDEALRTVYSAMDTFVLATNIGETFGLVLAESMCCNTPVVAMANPTRGNGQAEVVGQRRGGLIAANPKSLVKAMQIIKDDNDLRQHCAKEGREFVLEEYNSNKINSQLINLLQIVHQSPSRDALRSMLENDPAIVSSITHQELKDAWGGMVGEFTPKQRFVQHLVLSPRLQAIWNICNIKRNRKIKDEHKA